MIGRSRKITDNQTERLRVGLAETGQDRFHNCVGIDIDQGCFGTKNHHAGQRLILGVALQVGKAVGTGHTAEKGDVRTRHPGEQQQY